MPSRNGSQALADPIRLGFSTSRPVNSTPNPVVTALALAGFAFSLLERFSGLGDRGGRFCRVRPGGHLVLVGRFCRRSPSPCAPRPHPDPGRFQIGSDRLSTDPGLLLDAPQWPSESSQGNHFFFASFKTLLISTKATCLTPKSTSRASFSLAGFQVTLIGRFWVTPEAETVICCCTVAGVSWTAI